MSAALSSRPLLGRASAPLSAAAATATTKTAPTNAPQRTNASADSAASAPSYASTSRVLASGTTSSLWLDRSALAYDILIGQNFVVHRPRRGGPGLVPSPRPPAFARTTRSGGGGPEGCGPEKQQQRSTSLDSASRFRPRSGPPARRGGSSSSAAAAPSRFLLLSAAGGDTAASFFDVTDYSVVEASSSSPSSNNAAAPAAAASPAAAAPSAPRVFFLGTSGGLAAPGGGAFAPSSPAAAVSSPSPSPAPPNNPRRTRRLAWTCNLCGGRKVSPVNPLAWEKGSIFIRCSRCDVVHKVRDNLKIFHELAGQVYPVGNGNALPPEAAAAAEAALRKWNRGN